MKALKLNNNTSIDIERLIAGRMAILANSGGGKSFAVRRIAEQAAGKVQTIILDPEGEFATLREKHDFILCGKGQDVPVELRSAAMLATMLLEARTSAVVDMYELHPRDRKTFVKIFCETLVNAPRELHHPCLVFLDEAHDYVPEGKPSEATDAVESLASKGRKRGYALILVSQRISKVSKDALSECSNMLIGKSTWAIDRKRAAEELGLTDKKEVLELKNMKPGEFYATGPAISDEVIRIQVGEVHTTHGKTGVADYKPQPPSPALKKALSKLAELPAEVEKEANTSKELKEQLRVARGHILKLEKGAPKTDIEKEVQMRLQPHILAIESERNAWELLLREWKKYGEDVQEILRGFATRFNAIADGAMPSNNKPTGLWKNPPVVFSVPKLTSADLKDVQVGEIIKISPSENTPIRGAKLDAIIHDEFVHDGELALTGPEAKILNAIAWFEDIGIKDPEQVAVAFLAGYTFGGGAFMNPRGSLRVKGLVEYVGSCIRLTSEGSKYAKHPPTPPTGEQLRAAVLAVLSGPERRILEPLFAAYPEPLGVLTLAQIAGYAPTGGAFNNPKGRLRTLGLIEYLSGGLVKAKDFLFPA